MRSIKEPKVFYRVCNTETQQGLWYNFKGRFTGLIHNEFNFCEHNKLEMEFDPLLKGYLSSAESLEGLYFWFPQEDILKLQEHGFKIHEYESTDYWFYDRFQHMVINQEEAKLLRVITL